MTSSATAMKGESQYDVATSGASLTIDNVTSVDFSSSSDHDQGCPQGWEMNGTHCPFSIVRADNHFLMNAYTPVVSGYVAPTLVVVTLLTNTLVCVVLLKKHMRTPTNTILVAMAIADMLTGIWPIPSFIYFYSLGHWKEMLVPYDWCYAYDVLCQHLPTIFHTASIWLTVALAVQRYVYVCHSLLAKRWCTIPNVLKVIAAIYCTSVASQFTLFIEFVYIPVPLPSPVDNQTVIGCARKHSSFVEENRVVYFNMYFWFRVIFMSFVPCISLVFLNALLINAMRSAQARRQLLLKQNRNTESKRLKDSNCTTLMLVVVVGVFLLVELPVAICMIIKIIEINRGTHILRGEKYNVAEMFINLFILLSYPINFFIYCGMSREFRETFKQLFQRGRASPGAERSQYVSLLSENRAKPVNAHETAV